MTDWNSILTTFRTQAETIRRGGGAKAAERQHEKNRLTARERIAGLIDPGTEFVELGLWSAHGMYAEWGGAPAAGMVGGLGRVEGRWFLIVANDATVKAGAFFPMTAKKVLRAQKIAIENRLPVLYLVDSAGVFLPLQDEIFPDEDDFGRVFYNNSIMSAMGIPQIAAIMGNCVAGGGYLPVLCDKLVMTEGSGMYLAGPALVKSSIGQEVSHEELGGAQMHAEISGTIDFREPDDPACLRRLRSLAATLSRDPQAAQFVRAEPAEPARPVQDILKVITPNPQKNYDVRELLNCVLDAATFQEYKADYGRTLVCGYARLGGFNIGVIANQHQPVQNGQGHLQMGSVLYYDSADKAARFILDCNQTWLPIVFFQDVYGFMVGKQSEQAGVIRSGAKLVNAISNSRVPKLTVIVGGSYGAGNYALCGKAFAPRLVFAWPTARYAVMGSRTAAATILDINIAALKRSGKTPDVEELEQLRRQVAESYEEQTDIRYAAARGWVDSIIEPTETRAALITALEISTRHADDRPFPTGVFQV